MMFFFQPSVSGKHSWQYMLWAQMLQRSFCQKWKQKHPSYKDVTCCDEWLSFANFFEWANKEVDYSGKPIGFELDKDVLSVGSKVYSPATCSFLPRFINTLLTGGSKIRSEWPVGVCYNKRGRNFLAQIGCFGTQRSLGNYGTAEEAFQVYKKAKESYVKVVADQYRGVLKPSVYESLMKWEVSK